MARPQYSDVNRINTGLGIFNDLEANVQAIVKKAFMSSNNPRSNPNPLARYEGVEVLIGDPEATGLCHKRTTFVWTEASDYSIRDLGQKVENQNNNIVEQYLTNIAYYVTGDDHHAIHKEVRHVADTLAHHLIQTGASSLRGIMDGHFTVTPAELGVTYKIVNKKICRVQMAKLTIIFRRSRKLIPVSVR